MAKDKINDQWAFQVMKEDFAENAGDSEVVRAVNRLSTADRQILLTWVYYGTAKTARRYHCSPSFMRRRVKEIIDKANIRELCYTLRH